MEKVFVRGVGGTGLAAGVRVGAGPYRGLYLTSYRGATRALHINVLTMHPTLRLSRGGHPPVLHAVRAVNTYSLFEKLTQFKPAIEDDGSTRAKKYEGFPEYDTEFAKKGDKLDTTIEVGSKLLNAGKVNYKFVTPQSMFFEEKQKQLTHGKGSEQIRRLARSWITEVDRDKEKQFATRSLGWNSKIIDVDSEEYAQTRRRPLNPDDVIAYSHYLMPARYCIAKRVLKELKLVLPNFSPTRVLGKWYCKS
jgi:hypothetical protein